MKMTSEKEIEAYFKKLGPKHQNTVLSKALKYVCEKTGHSLKKAIAKGLGYENYSGDPNEYFKVSK